MLAVCFQCRITASLEFFGRLSAWSGSRPQQFRASLKRQSYLHTVPHYVPTASWLYALYIDLLLTYLLANGNRVGGVAQWLERWSLAGELSLIYAWSIVDMWPLRG